MLKVENSVGDCPMGYDADEYSEDVSSRMYIFYYDIRNGIIKGKKYKVTRCYQWSTYLKGGYKPN